MTEMIVDMDESGPVTFENFMSYILFHVADHQIEQMDPTFILGTLARGEYFAKPIRHNALRGVTTWLVCHTTPVSVTIADEVDGPIIYNGASSFHRDIIYVKD